MNAVIIKKLFLNCYLSDFGGCLFHLFNNNRIKMWNLQRQCLIKARAAYRAVEAILPQLSLVECLVLSFGTLGSSGGKRLLRPGPVMQKTTRIRSSL